MADQPAFKAELFQNPYLPAGGTVVDAVVTVTASGDGMVAAGGAPPSVAQVIMVDCSGSMTSPYTKLTEAKKATMTAIDTLREGVPFAIVAGRGRADMVYPSSVQLVPANAQTREQAKAAVNRLNGSGGTAMGTWLTLANHLFARSTAEVKHAIMLTDGENQHETAEQLAMVLQACQGRFVCDTRGVGEGWKGTELLKIASALLGSADALEEPNQLVADFKEMTEKAMGKSIAEVNLRLWTPAGATVRFVKQAWPHMEDLTARRKDISARIGDYPTGAWGAEHRDYHVSIQVPANAVGEEMLAGRVSLVSGDQVLAQSLVLANWTDDMALSTQINPRVAHYTGQAELAEAIQEGLAARDAGDVEKATAKLGRAVQIAEESGHTETAKLLGKVVDVVDARQGTVRLKQKVEGVDAELASVRSVKTVRVKGT
jgi:von Willebrand factor type A C-terminal domain/von Willebrand factor type A domain